MGFLQHARYWGGQFHPLLCDRMVSPGLFTWRFLFTTLWLGWLCYPGMAQAADPHAILQRMAQAYDRIYDYTALFLKRERIDGTLLPLEQIEFRFQEPFKVSMTWIEPHEGRTIVFVQGANDNKLLVSPGGLLSFLRLALDPSSDMATRDVHHTILQAGMRNTIRHIMQEYRRGMEQHQVVVRFLGYATVDNRPTYHLGLTYPADKSAGYYAYRGELWIDKEHYLPTRMEVYDWDNQLYEHYEYHRLQLNPGLHATTFRLPSIAPATASKLQTQQRDATP